MANSDSSSEQTSVPLAFVENFFHEDLTKDLTKDGMTVTLVPRRYGTPGARGWRASVARPQVKGQPSMDIVYAKSGGPVQLPSGAVAHVHKGQHWPATDQVVRLRPELFTTDPRFGLLYTEAPPGYDGELNEVEEATANPGEKRSVRRS